MYLRQQSSSAYPIPVLLVGSTDHVTPLGAGVTPVVKLRKNGAAAATAAGTITATDASGIAYLNGNAVDRSTPGSLVLEVTAAGADPVTLNYTIVPWDPFATNLPVNLLQWRGSTPTVLTPSGLVQTDLEDVGNQGLDPTALSDAILAAATADQSTTILARLGPFTGTGVNTAFGFLACALAPDAPKPSDLAAYTYDPATGSLGAIAGAVGEIPTTGGGMTSDQSAKLNSIYTSTGQLAMGVRPIITPVQPGTITVIQGDSYLDANGNAIRIPKAANAPWPTDLTGWTISVSIQPTDATTADPNSAAAPTLSITGDVVTATGDDQAVRFDLTAAQSASLLVPSNGGAAAYQYSVRASNGSERVTLEVGTMTVVAGASN